MSVEVLDRNFDLRTKVEVVKMQWKPCCVIGKPDFKCFQRHIIRWVLFFLVLSSYLFCSICIIFPTEHFFCMVKGSLCYSSSVDAITPQKRYAMERNTLESVFVHRKLTRTVDKLISHQPLSQTLCSINAFLRNILWLYMWLKNIAVHKSDWRRCM